MDLLKQDSSTREDFGMLAVMDALAEKEQITQRELARKTGLNLKKVNYCLHKLLEKGHIKFQRALSNPDKRTYLYILTPSGAKAKSWLTYRFLKFTLEFYSQVEAMLSGCLRLMQEACIRRLILGGISDAVRIVVEHVEDSGIEIVGVLDWESDVVLYEGLPILRGDDLKTLEWDGVLITTLDDAEAFDRRLRSMGLPDSKVWHLSSGIPVGGSCAPSHRLQSA